MSLSILNTICIIMTIMLLMTSIFLVITKSNKEIAIMKISSIDHKKIKKAFQLQFNCYSIPSIVVGSVLSIYLGTLKLLIGMMFGVSVQLTSKMIIVPLVISLIIIGSIFLIPINFVNKSTSFEQLKELD